MTGDYRRSIALDVGTDRGSPTAAVGTDKPQGRRLELGFADTDSLGRSFDQAPRPHFGPALDSVEPGFVKAIADLAVED